MQLKETLSIHPLVAGSGKPSAKMGRRERQLRQLFLAVVISSFALAVPQIARGDIIEDPSNPGTYVASGANVTSQLKNGVDDINVITDSTFSVVLPPTENGHAVGITGAGALSYLDENSSNLVSSNGFGLYYHSTGDSGAADGLVTIVTNGEITGIGGIRVINNGSGLTNVTASGSITGTENANAIGRAGVSVSAGVDAGTVTINTTNDDNTNLITGAFYGVRVDHQGTGDINIDIDHIESYQAGIYAVHAGTGSIDVNSWGEVQSEIAGGIYAGIHNAGSTGSINVEASDFVSGGGGNAGIMTRNLGSGSSEVLIHGSIQGNAWGILASNESDDSGTLFIEATDVNGVIEGVVRDGISAINHGGDIEINTAGTVTGNTGISVRSGVADQGNNTGAVTIDSNIASGGAGHGIGVTHYGTGSIGITAHGDTTSNTGAGIYINRTNSDNTDSITITNEQLVSGNYGIQINSVAGDTTVNNEGDIRGGARGILINGGSTFEVEVHNSAGASIANISELTSGRTIDSLGLGSNPGSTTTVNNLGEIIGSVGFTGNDNLFNNEGEWHIGGSDSTFGVNGTLRNFGGSLITAVDQGGTNFTTTRMRGAATVEHAGVLTMQNDIVGDRTIIGNSGPGVFESHGGSLFVDTSFQRGNQLSDVLVIDNGVSVDGATRIYVNPVNRLGAPTQGDGIEVIDVSGVSTNDAFTLANSLKGGFYSYGLDQGQVDTESWFLQSSLLPETATAGVLPVLGARTALSTLSNLHNRERDAKIIPEELDSQKGLWARAFGQGTDFHAKGGNKFGYDAKTWGAQVGLDLMASTAEESGRKYAGLYLAYASSNGDAFDRSGKVGSLDLDATSLGAYYTRYSPDGWYLDAVAQYSRLGGIKAKTATENMKPSGSGYAVSLEGGRQFHLESSVIRELQAQLIYQHTSIDDVTLSDRTRFAMANLSNVIGRVGVRLSKNPDSGKRLLPWVRANVWHTFGSDSEISSMGTTISTPTRGTSGELQVGFTMGPGDSGKWNLYGSAGYLFELSGAEYSGWKGTLGLRKGW